MFIKGAVVMRTCRRGGDEEMMSGSQAGRLSAVSALFEPHDSIDGPV